MPTIEIPGVPDPVDSPVVILGTNASGKTRLGVRVGQKNRGRRIAARRQLDTGSLGTNLGNAAGSLRNNRSQLDNAPYRQAQDTQDLLSKLFGLTASVATSFVSNFNTTSPERRGDLSPIEPPFLRLKRLWEAAVDGRTIDLSPEAVRVTDHRPSRPIPAYEINQGSDGERTILYLAAQIVDADDPSVATLVVDEPTVHLHGELARRFWNAAEAELSEKAWVYITHNLDFALSRRDATFLVPDGNGGWKAVADAKSIPDRELAALLGVATFGVSAERLILCESKPSGLDERLYTAWFGSSGTVIPVGTASDVRNTATALRQRALVRNVDGLVAIVDRDELTSSQVNAATRDHIHVLDVSEIESLLCFEEIIRAVATHLSLDPTSAFERARESVSKITDVEKEKLILDRVRRALRPQLGALLDSVKPDASHNVVASRVSEALASVTRYASVLNDAHDEVNAVLGRGNWFEILRIMPGKFVYGRVRASLGDVPVVTYEGIVIGALRGEEAFRVHSEGIRTALAAVLPDPKMEFARA